MQIPLQISFRNMDASEAVEADIREKVGRLERFYDRITGCRVIVEAPHRHRHKGNLYDVCVDVTVPGEEIVVQRSGPENPAHEDVYVAVRDAFDAATRRLQDHVRKATGRVKTHELPVHGTVVRLSRGDGYGFIETSEGDEIYFHRNSVVDGSFETSMSAGKFGWWLLTTRANTGRKRAPSGREAASGSVVAHRVPAKAAARAVRRGDAPVGEEGSACTNWRSARA